MGKNRIWMYVVIAGMMDVVWVSGLKHSDTVLEWIGTGLSILISFYILIKATKHLPIGTVYAVFAGLGTGGTVVVEMLLFDEPFSWGKIALIGLLLVGVVGLKLADGEEAQPSGLQRSEQGGER